MLNLSCWFNLAGFVVSAQPNNRTRSSDYALGFELKRVVKNAKRFGSIGDD